MDAYIIGKLIKEFRVRKGYSQEELCYGLCAVSTLSRIESGIQAFPKAIFIVPVFSSNSSFFKP